MQSVKLKRLNYVKQHGSKIDVPRLYVVPYHRPYHGLIAATATIYEVLHTDQVNAPTSC